MKKKKQSNSIKIKLFLVILLVPVTIFVYFLIFLSYQQLKSLQIIQSLFEDEMDKIQAELDIKIPEEYIPIYMEAAEKYQIPWTLLAAEHRVETRFSTMSTLVSPVGAEGHMQFMPCTFVGWDHPTCNGLGQGKIPEEDKTNPKVIAKYGGYGVDANNDGKADPFDIEDSIFSAANFLSKAGAKEGDLKKAIYQYNHDEKYVEDVLYFYHQYEKIRNDIEIVVASKK